MPTIIAKPKTVPPGIFSDLGTVRCPVCDENGRALLLRDKTITVQHWSSETETRGKRRGLFKITRRCRPNAYRVYAIVADKAPRLLALLPELPPEPDPVDAAWETWLGTSEARYVGGTSYAHPYDAFKAGYCAGLAVRTTDHT